MVLGAPGRNFISWSHGLLGGNLCDSSSENTRLCLWYSFGIATSLILFGVLTIRRMVTLALSRRSLQSSDRTTTGRCHSSIVPCPHRNFGSNAACQGYPRTRCSFPRPVIKNLIILVSFPVRTSKSVYSFITPAALVVPSMFHTFRGFSSCNVVTPNFLANSGSMKLSVAPESVSVILSAIIFAVLKCTVTFIDLFIAFAKLVLAQIPAVRMCLPQNPVPLGIFCSLLLFACCLLPSLVTPGFLRLIFSLRRRLWAALSAWWGILDSCVLCFGIRSISLLFLACLVLR